MIYNIILLRILLKPGSSKKSSFHAHKLIIAGLQKPFQESIGILQTLDSLCGYNKAAK